MERPSPVGGDTLECAVSPGLGCRAPNAGVCPGVWNVSSAQATQVHNTCNCVVLGEHCGGVCSGYKGCQSPQRPLQGQWLGAGADSGGGWSWWCAHSSRGQLRVYVVVGAVFKHTQSVGGQGQLQRPRPTAGVPAAVGTMAVRVSYCGCKASPRWAQCS